MSEIRTELDRIISQVEEGHSKATAKGGTPQSSKTLANLLTAIDTIPEATAPKLQAKTATPSESAQTVKPDSGYDGLSQVSVGAISKTYVGSSVPKQAAQTITPGTADKTIASGQYLTGVQTIKGDSNLKAENIKNGVSIFGVAGTLEEGGASTGALEYVSGSFSTSNAAFKGITITGLGFKPTHVDVFYGDYGKGTGSFGSGTNSGTRFYLARISRGVHDSLAQTAVGDNKAPLTFYPTTGYGSVGYGMTLTEDGFTISCTSSTKYTYSGIYSYIAYK